MTSSVECSRFAPGSATNGAVTDSIRRGSSVGGATPALPRRVLWVCDNGLRERVVCDRPGATAHGSVVALALLDGFIDSGEY